MDKNNDSLSINVFLKQLSPEKRQAVRELTGMPLNQNIYVVQYTYRNPVPDSYQLRTAILMAEDSEDIYERVTKELDAIVYGIYKFTLNELQSNDIFCIG